jgi:hypothetical protein
MQCQKINNEMLERPQTTNPNDIAGCGALGRPPNPEDDPDGPFPGYAEWMERGVRSGEETMPEGPGDEFGAGNPEGSVAESEMRETFSGDDAEEEEQIHFPILDEEKKKAVQLALIQRVGSVIGDLIKDARRSSNKMAVAFSEIVDYLVEIVRERKNAEEVMFRASTLGALEEGGYRFLWPRILAAVTGLAVATVREYMKSLPGWEDCETDVRLWDECPIMGRLFVQEVRSDSVHVKRLNPDFGLIPRKPVQNVEDKVLSLRMSLLRFQKENVRLKSENDEWKRENAKLLEQNELLKVTLSMALKDSTLLGENHRPEEGDGPEYGAEYEGRQIEPVGEGENRVLYPIPMVQYVPREFPLTDEDKGRRVEWLRALLEAAEAELRGGDRGQRRFDDDLKALGFVLFALNRHSYGMIHEALGLASDVTVWGWAAERRARLKETIIDGEPSKMIMYLREYREWHKIPDGEKVRVNLGVDATSATANGLRNKDSKTGYCFVFVMFPHNADYPDLVLRSVYSDTGNLSPAMKLIRDGLERLLTLCDFLVRWKCTDGDVGMNCEHNSFQAEFHACGARLEGIVKFVQVRMNEGLEAIRRAETVPLGERVVETPVERPVSYGASDDFHIEKNVRSRGAAAVDGKTLSVAADVRGTCAEKLEKYTGGPSGPFGKRKSLDKLSDALAEEAFNMYSLNAAQEASDLPSWLFLLPFTCISEVFRRRRISVEVRLGLLDIAYAALRAVYDAWPATGGEEGIFEKKSQGPVVMTLWMKQTIVRTMNLCITLYLEILEWVDSGCSYDLALSRFGTHSIECHFGIVRSLMKGDSRLERFLSAQMKAVLVRHIMWEKKFPGYLPRFRNNEGGIILKKDMEFIPMPELDFPEAIDEMGNIVSTLRKQSGHQEGSRQYHEDAAPVMRTMRQYFDYLNRAGEIQQVRKWSPTSGMGLNRWLVHMKTE